MTNLQLSANFEQRTIELELLVKGNFIVRVNDDPDLAKLEHFPYYSETMDSISKILNFSLYANRKLQN